MLNVIVTDPPRADLAAVDALAPYGVATVHEAIGRNGYLGPAIRPNQQGARIAGVALTVVCWPGDNLMIHAAVEQARPGDIIVITTTSPSSDGGVRRTARHLARRPRRPRPDHGGGPARHAGNYARWASPPGPRTSPPRAPSRRPPARSTSRSRSAARRSAPATRSSPTTTACASSPASDVAAAVTASAARIAKEDANRRELADGVLGLDLYNLRPKLARVEYISYAEYAKRAGEGS